MQKSGHGMMVKKNKKVVIIFFGRGIKMMNFHKCLRAGIKKYTMIFFLLSSNINRKFDTFQKKSGSQKLDSPRNRIFICTFSSELTRFCPRTYDIVGDFRRGRRRWEDDWVKVNER